MEACVSRFKLTITVDDEHLGSTSQIATRLQDHGVTIERVVAAAGAIFGSADEAVAKEVSQVEGVQDVRSSRTYQLPELNPLIPQ